jgi:hypothetical protein
MEQSFEQQEISTQEPGNFFANHHVFESLMKWLGSLTLLTKAELEEAGVYIGDHQDHENRP